jgi:thiamine pyrophosphate-dependent acetolactate synthase large subunit-like protein
VEATRVRRPADAANAVRRMLSHDGPYLIDLNTA